MSFFALFFSDFFRSEKPMETDANEGGEDKKEDDSKDKEETKPQKTEKDLVRSTIRMLEINFLMTIDYVIP